MPKLDRLKDHLYSNIYREQAGFRPASSCIDHNTLRIIIEQSAEYRSDLHLVFVDFEKGFDCVDREGLWIRHISGEPSLLMTIGNGTLFNF